MASLSASKLHIFHGGEFQRVANLMYTEGECSEVEVDPYYLSVDDMKESVSKLGYMINDINQV